MMYKLISFYCTYVSSYHCKLLLLIKVLNIESQGQNAVVTICKTKIANNQLVILQTTKAM